MSTVSFVTQYFMCWVRFPNIFNLICYYITYPLCPAVQQFKQNQASSSKETPHDSKSQKRIKLSLGLAPTPAVDLPSALPQIQYPSNSVGNTTLPATWAASSSRPMTDSVKSTKSQKFSVETSQTAVPFVLPSTLSAGQKKRLKKKMKKAATFESVCP